MKTPEEPSADNRRFWQQTISETQTKSLLLNLYPTFLIISGGIIMGLYLGWIPLLGLLLIVWGNNAEQRLRVKR